MAASAEPQGPRRFNVRAVRLLVALEAVAVVSLTAGILVIAAIQVVTRYVLNDPVQWTEEVAQLALVWLIFISAGLVSASDGHVTVRILGNLLGPLGRRLLAALAYIAVIVSVITVIWYSIDPTEARMGLPLPATHWPAGLTYVGVLVGLGLVAVHTAINLWVLLRGGYAEAPEDVEGTLI